MTRLATRGCWRAASTAGVLGAQAAGGCWARRLRRKSAAGAAHLQGPPQGRVAAGDGRVVAGPHVELAVVFEQQRPARGVQGPVGLGLDGVCSVGRAVLVRGAQGVAAARPGRVGGSAAPVVPASGGRRVVGRAGSRGAASRPGLGPAAALGPAALHARPLVGSPPSRCGRSPIVSSVALQQAGKHASRHVNPAFPARQMHAACMRQLVISTLPIAASWRSQSWEQARRGAEPSFFVTLF